MGVDLRKIVKPRKIQLSSLSGRTIAIDAYNTIYQFLSIIRGASGENLKDTSGRITSHLSGLFYRNVNLLSFGMKPIYILDGKPPELKSAEIQRRRVIKQESIIRYENALRQGDLDAAKKFAKATSTMRSYMIDDTKRILSLLGIPWLNAPSEGEATAAHLTKVGVATHAASQDYDSILFGATKLIRNLAISGKRKLPNRAVYVNVEPEEVELRHVLEKLGISREQLIDVGILLGTDFNPDGFERIGPATALKYIKQYERLEDIPSIKVKLSTMDYQAVRDIFLNPKVTSFPSVNWSDVDADKIVDFLCGERDFSEERIRSALRKLEERNESQSQSLNRWFG